MTLQYPEATQRSSRNKKYVRDEQKMTSSTGIFNMLYVQANVKDPFSPHRRTGVLFVLWNYQNSSNGLCAMGSIFTHVL
jgi:hypothetical protein